MKAVIIGAMTVVAIVFQSSLAQYIQILGVKPDLVLILVVSLALLRGSHEGAMTGVFAGLLKDILFGKVFGLQAILFMFMGLAAGSINKKLFKENIFVMMFATFLSTLFFETAFFFFSAFIKGQTQILWFFKTLILPEAAYNCLAAIPIFIIVTGVNRKIVDLGIMWKRY